MKKFNKTLTVLGILLLASTALLAQDKALKKAERLYKAYQYNSAIPFFEYYLDKEKNKKVLTVKTKLAYCYKMSNQFSEAEELYAEIVQEPKARPITLYYYAEALMATGKYDEAKSWFLKYEILEPEDEGIADMIAACDNVDNLVPYFADIAVRPIEINTDADDFSPAFCEDGVAFLSDRGERGSTYAWTGRPFLKLYKSEKGVDGKFLEVSEFSKKINEYRKNTGPVSISEDGETIMITRNSDVPTKSNRYNLQLFEATKRGNSWTRGKLLDFCKKEQNYMHPALSPTGDTMYFVSDKAGSVGGTDIYMTYRTPRGWKRPINLGEVINTSGHEAFPYVHSDGTLYFSSKGHGGYGGFDVYKAEKDADGEFTKVINLGTPINSPKDDTGFILAKNKKFGYFASSRQAGNDDIFLFEIDNFQLKGEVLAYAGESKSLNTVKSSRKPKSKTPIKAIEIKGKIVDKETNKPLNNVKVTLTTRDGVMLKELAVDAQGNVSGVLNADEDYIINVSKIGYRSKSKFITTVNIANEIKPVFKLKKQ